MIKMNFDSVPIRKTCPAVQQVKFFIDDKQSTSAKNVNNDPR